MSEARGEATAGLQVLDRLGRRGALTITVEDGNFDVQFKSPGPFGRLSWCTTDKADLFTHCRLGSKNWHGEGPDLDALLTECEEATRPEHRDVDDLRWEIESRRESRTLGPPLPTYMRWHGWRHGEERWLRTSIAAREYVGGYVRDLEAEAKFNAESDARRIASELPRIQRAAG